MSDAIHAIVPSDDRFFRRERGQDEPDEYIPYVRFVKLNINFGAVFEPTNYASLVWVYNMDDSTKQFPVLVAPSIVDRTIIPVMMPTQVANNVIGMHVKLTGAMISSFKTCWLRFELQNNRVCLFLVNKVSGRKTLIETKK